MQVVVAAVVDVGNASLDPIGGWFEGRRDALSKGVGDGVRPVDPSGAPERVGAQGRARSSTPGIVHRRCWHRTIGRRPTWVASCADVASSPGPAGDDDGRGRLCTTLRRDGLQRPENGDGSHTVAHPLGQRVARLAGLVRAGSSDALPPSTPASATIIQFFQYIVVWRRLLNELHEPTIRAMRCGRMDSCLLPIVPRSMLESCRCVRCGWRTISSWRQER